MLSRVFACGQKPELQRLANALTLSGRPTVVFQPPVSYDQTPVLLGRKVLALSPLSLALSQMQLLLASFDSFTHHCSDRWGSDESSRTGSKNQSARQPLESLLRRLTLLWPSRNIVSNSRTTRVRPDSDRTQTAQDEPNQAADVLPLTAPFDNAGTTSKRSQQTDTTENVQSSEFRKLGSAGIDSIFGPHHDSSDTRWVVFVMPINTYVRQSVHVETTGVQSIRALMQKAGRVYWSSSLLRLLSFKRVKSVSLTKVHYGHTPRGCRALTETTVSCGSRRASGK